MVEAMPDATSLDLPVGAEETSRIGDFVEDERASDIPGEALRAQDKAHLNQAIECLPARARYVLIRRYGLDDGEPASLDQLSRELGLSKDWIRDLQRNTERALKTAIPGAGSLQSVA